MNQKWVPIILMALIAFSNARPSKFKPGRWGKGSVGGIWIWILLVVIIVLTLIAAAIYFWIKSQNGREEEEAKDTEIDEKKVEMNI